MLILAYLLTCVLSAFFWRVRGGLDIWKGDKVPANKIWFAVFVGCLYCVFRGWSIEGFANVSIATFVAHQICSWGVYIGRLLQGGVVRPEIDKENPLVDEIIMPLHITIKGNKFYLYQYPRLYGFVGTTLTGLMITYLMGLAIGSFWFGFSGVMMGVCYYLGSLLDKVKPDGKGGWNWGEWIFGGSMGIALAWCLV